MNETSSAQLQSPVLQGNSTMNTEKEMETDQKNDSQQKSSISVIFTDWVPAEGENSAMKYSEENYSPIFSGTGSRYFHVQRGHGKIRPGLGTNVEDLIQKAKPKKRKKPPMIDLLQDTASISKRVLITPEKPASAFLNELNSNLEYQYEEVKVEGSKGMPTFSCSVMFPPDSGNVFVGEGRSKKLAKNDAAEKALASLGVIIPPKPEVTSPNPIITSDNATSGFNQQQAISPFPRRGNMQCFQPQIPMLTNDLDFASDDIISVNFTAPQNPMLSQPMVDAGVFRRLRNIPNFEENICLALNTIVLPGMPHYEYLGEEGPPHEKVFTIKLTCNMQEYFGKGGSKKKAKADAAKKAVITLLGEDCYKTMVNSSLQISQSHAKNSPEIQSGDSKSKKGKQKKMKPTDPTDANVKMEEEDEDDDDENDDWGEYDLNFSDCMANLVREKYEELMKNDVNFSPFKVLAGVVMTNGSPMLYNATVIAVTTGTKCIDGDCLSDEGLSVNDCHAEILATRCIRDYLYSQIELFESAKTDMEKLQCILEENLSPTRQHKYQLKSDVRFHLFISTSPCGDARIFSPKGIEVQEEEQPSPTDFEDTHPNKMNRGVLRSKIEAGEGTIPAANLYNGPQTWDSIVSGNALYTMSCSDKVCRWNVLGFQGALLYNLIGTVFYSSITLGSLHHPVHFKRAVYGRIEPLGSRLEIPFSVHKPKLMMVSREEKRRVKKSPNHAVCWCIDWSTPEILAASKGRCEGGVASRLTKRMAFNRFLKLYKNESGRRENYIDMTYHDAKCIASDYQKAKNEFIEFFKDSKLGPWIGKPLEQDSFKIK